MKNKPDLTLITIWVNRLIACILLILIFALPTIVEWYCQYRTLLPQERTALMIAFYCCCVVIALALWNMDCLLRCIHTGSVFTRINVRRIRTVQWCCAGVSLICLPASMVYYPLVFLVVIMAFLSLVVSVVCRVMDTAVTIREENDLTI